MRTAVWADTAFVRKTRGSLTVAIGAVATTGRVPFGTGFIGCRAGSWGRPTPAAKDRPGQRHFVHVCERPFKKISAAYHLGDVASGRHNDGGRTAVLQQDRDQEAALRAENGRALTLHVNLILVPIISPA